MQRTSLILILLIMMSLLLCACASDRGATTQYEGYTVRTEKTRESEDRKTVEGTKSAVSSAADVVDMFVLNKSSMKFHDPSCSAVSDILEKNRWDYRGTRESVIDMGYAPCGICKP